MYKSEALEKAIEIAKEFGRGGNVTDGDYLIESCYKKIVEIAEKEGFLKEE